MEQKQITLEEHLKSQKVEPQLAKLILSFSHIALDAQHHFPRYLAGTMGDKNKYGEAVAKLDEWINGYLCDKFVQTGLVRKIYSEELKEPLVATTMPETIPGTNSKSAIQIAPFVVTLDPLDGSSNIVTNNPFGTIVGVYREDLPQAGRKLVAAIYKLYGPVNTLVYTTGNGTHEFVKHYDSQGNARFYLLAGNMKIPEPGEVFGLGGDPLDWDAKFLSFAKDLFRKEKLRVRYCGTFVADFSQILHRGGIFAYPSTRKNPKGKLRLTYEAAPMGFIWEQAGGASWSGKSSLLDVADADADSRVPLYMGNKSLVEKLKKALS